MGIQINNSAKMYLAVLLATLVGAGLPATADPGLGISVSFEKADQTDAEVTGSIWAGGDQGSQLTRTILIRSLSDNLTQAISFDIFDQILVNDEITTDTSVPSRISNWVTFSPAEPLVPPGGEVRVKMKIDIPIDAEDGAFDATLRVMAGSVENLEELENEGSGVKAVVGTRLAMDSGMWLGVGDALDLMPNFEIVGVDGALIEGSKYVRVFFENTGLVPLRLTGRLQLADASFADVVFEPVDFVVPQIRTNEKGYVDVPVQPDIEDGYYRSLVLAQHGGVRKTEIFEGELIFDDPNQLTIPDFLLRGALLVAAFGALVFGYRMIRSSTKGVPKTSSSNGHGNATPIGIRSTMPRMPANFSTSARSQALRAKRALDSLAKFVGQALEKLSTSAKTYVESRKVRATGEDNDASTSSQPKLPRTSLWPLPKVGNLETASAASADTGAFQGESWVASPRSLELAQAETETGPALPISNKKLPLVSKPRDRKATSTQRNAAPAPRPLYPYWYQPPSKGK